MWSASVPYNALNATGYHFAYKPAPRLGTGLLATGRKRGRRLPRSLRMSFKPSLLHSKALQKLEHTRAAIAEGTRCVCDPGATPFHIKNDTVVTEAKGRLELGVGVPLMIPGPATHTHAWALMPRNALFGSKPSRSRSRGAKSLAAQIKSSRPSLQAAIGFVYV